MAVWMFSYCLLILSSLCIEFAFAASVPCTLKVFEEHSTNNQPIEGVCLEEFETPDCQPFLRQFNRSDLPKGFSLTDDDDSVEKPETLTLSLRQTIHRYDEIEYVIPAVLFDWRAPVSSLSRKNTKGFLMIWTNGTIDRCRLFKFNSSRTDLLSKELHFQYYLRFLEANQNFTMKVYSLPPPDNLKESQKVSTFVSETLTSGSYTRNYSNPADWKPSVSYHVLKEGAIQVKIGHSPPQFNFTKFEVMLVKSSFNLVNAFKTLFYIKPPGSQSSEGVVTFTDLETDKYKIVVHVNDTFHRIDGKCLCWRMETKGRYCSWSCGNTGTAWMNVTGAANTNSKTTESTAGKNDNSPTNITMKVTSKSDEDVKKTGLIIGLSVTAVAVFFAAVALVGFRRLKLKGKDLLSFMRYASPKSLESKNKFGLEATPKGI
ncbi:hypothetical protein EGW08_013294, partial [Elysia chlorotica]